MLGVPGDTEATSVGVLLEQLRHHLGTSSLPEPERWRLSGIARCLKALSASNATPPDRAALLREVARLCGGAATLPLEGTGFSRDSLALLDRFDLDVYTTDGLEQMRLEVQLSSRPFPAGLPPVLPLALALDPSLRRRFAPEVPDALLLRLTKHGSYQTATQKAAVRALVTMPGGATLLVTMPTGSGKSLLFQLGSLWWRDQAQSGEIPGVLVIVPTVSLALDHERTLSRIPGLEASRAITGDNSASVRSEVIEGFVRGEVPVLILSPELALGTLREHLRMAAQPPARKVAAARARLAAVFVDEAHTIESWGRSFRPDFQRLPGLIADLRRDNPDLRTVLLSATVSDTTRALLEASYRAPTSATRFLPVAARTPRYEFDLVTHEVTDSKTRDRLVLAALDRIPRPALVYTTEVEDAEALGRLIREEGGHHRIAVFTGDTDPDRRRAIIHQWDQDDLDIVVATSAFGMGIDKGNVRAVVHACVPDDPARYYQEIGRAGRDGHQAVALCLWTREDIATAENLATRSWLTVNVAEERWKTLLDEASRSRTFASAGGTTTVALSLDAAPERLGPRPGKRNRGWNMTLLNLLQRQNAIEILPPEGERDDGRWRVRILKQVILEQSTAGHAALRDMLAVREEEKAAAQEALRDFTSLLFAPEDDCLIAGIFQLVEADRPLTAACGRCNGCRAQGNSPPETSVCGGGECAWIKPTNLCTPRERGRLLVHPDDESFDQGLRLLVERLHRIGVDQFLVPNGLGASVAALVARVGSGAGLVLEIRHFLDEGWAILNAPTALLLRPSGEGTWRNAGAYFAVRRRFEEFGDQLLVVVASSEQTIEGRRLSQIASPRAPYHEATLDRMASARGVS